MAKIKISTDTQIKSIIRQVSQSDKKEHTYSIAGCKGLSMRFRLKADNTVSSEFRHRYTKPYTNVQAPPITLGHYPACTLAQAKELHRDNMALLSQNIDPKQHREQEKINKEQALNNTFDRFVMQWLSEQTPRKPKTEYNNKLIRNMLIKEFAGQPMDTITAPQILNFITNVQKTSIDTGNRIKSMARKIFAYAEVKGVIKINPVIAVIDSKALKSEPSKPLPALTKPKDVMYLLQDIESIDRPTQPFIKPCLQLLTLTFVRINDLCSMKWADIDWEAKQWLFKPMKGRGREDMVSELIVPLAPKAIEILKELQKVTGGYKYVFYNHRRKVEPYLHNQKINEQLNSPTMNKQKLNNDFLGNEYIEGKGYKGIHCPHGFRAMAKTLLMERLGYSDQMTEIQLGHKPKFPHGYSYNRVEALKERASMMENYANYLEQIQAGNIDNITHVDFKSQNTKTG